MILVGVDVASKKHDVSIIRDTGEVIRDNFTIPNKESGYKKLLDEIGKAEKLYPSDKVRIGLESTGVYSMSLTEFLATHYEDSVILINPILTKKPGRNTERAALCLQFFVLSCLIRQCGRMQNGMTELMKEGFDRLCF